MNVHAALAGPPTLDESLFGSSTADSERAMDLCPDVGEPAGQRVAISRLGANVVRHRSSGFPDYV
jgi:hypothetical protein